MMRRIFVPLILVCAFFAGLACTSTVIRKAFPGFDAFTLERKLQHLAKHKDDYDTLFLGSSRVYHQISTALFDQIAEEGGSPVRSFNMGVDALFPPEDSYVAEYIAALQPRNLRWVFVEVSMFLPTWSEQNSQTPRAVYWHDWKRTSMAVRDLLSKPKRFEWKKRSKRWTEWREAVGRSGAHLAMYLRRETNLGRGTNILKWTLKPLPDRDTSGLGLGPGRDGYVPLGPWSKAKFNGHRHLHQKRLNSEIRYRALSPVAQENLDRIIATIRDMGATPVLLVSPALTDLFYVPREPANEYYLDFADVSMWEELYETEEHFIDSGHLSTAGATVYTRMVAESWLEKCRTREVQDELALERVTSTLDLGGFRR